MNIANPCKLFLIVSALTAGFAVSADGTLPIPKTSTQVLDDETDLPLDLKGQATVVESGIFGEVSREVDITMSLNKAKPSAQVPAVLKAHCPTGQGFYPASGHMEVGDDLFEIKGVCAPGKLTPGRRQVIAETAGRILQFDGTFDLAATPRSFDGDVLTIDNVTASPLSGDKPVKVMTFEMHN